MKKIKFIAIGIVVIFALFALYRLLFIRVVNYEIAGAKIPSEYNMLTGKVRPIVGYRGKATLPSIQPKETNKLGLSDAQVMIAQLRWAIFEEWIKIHPEYKGWETNAETFKKAHDEFRIELEKHTRAIAIQ